MPRVRTETYNMNNMPTAALVADLRFHADDIAQNYPVSAQSLCAAADRLERLARQRDLNDAVAPCYERLMEALLAFWRDDWNKAQVHKVGAGTLALEARLRLLRQLLRSAGLNPDNLDAQGNPRPMPTEEECNNLQSIPPLPTPEPQPVCSVCKWTNVSLLNLGEPGKPRLVCHGCCKQMADKIREQRALLSYAETLLCSAQPIPAASCTDLDWDSYVKNFRDALHGVKPAERIDKTLTYEP